MSAAAAAPAPAPTATENGETYVKEQEAKEAGKTDQEVIDDLQNQSDNTNAMQVQLLGIQNEMERHDLMFKSMQTQYKRLSDSAIT